MHFFNYVLFICSIFCLLNAAHVLSKLTCMGTLKLECVELSQPMYTDSAFLFFLGTISSVVSSSIHLDFIGLKVDISETNILKPGQIKPKHNIT